VRDSDDNTRVTNKGPWSRVADVVEGTNRMLASGASWSGHERNHLFFGGLHDHQFARLSGISGLDDPGDSRTFATLDFDRDGWLDIVLGNISAPRLRLFRNQIGQRASASNNHFVALRFVGGNEQARPSSDWSSRDGLGTYVAFDLGDGAHVYREHRLDDGLKAQNTATMVVGIGPRKAVHSVRVRWLSGRTQSTLDVPAGTLLTVYENPKRSPNGKAFVRESYRLPPSEARTVIARASHNWKPYLLPGERSHGSIVLKSTVSTRNQESATGLRLYAAMATWCTACATEVPELRKLREAFSKNELAMFGVPVDGEDTPTKLRSWRDKFAPPYDLLIALPQSDVAVVKGAIAAELKDTKRLPATIVTDSSGRVLLSSWGVPSISELRKLLWSSASP
jgi:peroxiredoxin